LSKGTIWGVIAWLPMILIFITLLAIYLSAPVEARGITVPIDYPDIQTALDNALDGDVITVLKGVYRGFEVRRSVTIIGESNQTVVVVGSVVVWANDVKLSSMKVVLENPSSGIASAVKILGSNALLTDLVIESDASGIQIGDIDHGYASASIEYTAVIAGRGVDLHPSPAGVWGVCSSLYIFYSNITLLNGAHSVVGCGYTQLMYSRVSSGSSGVRIGRGEIRGSVISASGTGVVIAGGNVVVESSTVSSSDIGVDVFQSNGNLINGNTIDGLNAGIRVVGSSNVISRNTVSSSGSAVELRGSDNVIVNNTLSGSRGVNGLNAYGNTIAFNFINRTGHIGVYMSESTGNNVIYGNTFWLCYNYNAADESGGNQWYFENESLRMGNYWSGHTSPDNNGDGIVDVPYAIATTTGLQILDKYPLVNPVVRPPWETTTTPWGTTTTSPTSTPSTPYTSSPTETQPPPQSITESPPTPLYFIALTTIPIATLVVAILLILRKRR